MKREEVYGCDAVIGGSEKQWSVHSTKASCHSYWPIFTLNRNKRATG